MIAINIIIMAMLHCNVKCLSAGLLKLLFTITGNSHHHSKYKP